MDDTDNSSLHREITYLKKEVDCLKKDNKYLFTRLNYDRDTYNLLKEKDKLTQEINNLKTTIYRRQKYIEWCKHKHNYEPEITLETITSSNDYIEKLEVDIQGYEYSISLIEQLLGTK